MNMVIVFSTLKSVIREILMQRKMTFLNTLFLCFTIVFRHIQRQLSKYKSALPLLGLFLVWRFLCRAQCTRGWTGNREDASQLFGYSGFFQNFKTLSFWLLWFLSKLLNFKTLILWVFGYSGFSQNFKTLKLWVFGYSGFSQNLKTLKL